MNSLWSVTIEEYFEICHIAKDNGVKAGESIEPYFMAYMELKKQKPLGHTELSKAEYIKELVSHNKTILNLDNEGIKIIVRKKDK